MKLISDILCSKLKCSESDLHFLEKIDLTYEDIVKTRQEWSGETEEEFPLDFNDIIYYSSSIILEEVQNKIDSKKQSIIDNSELSEETKENIDLLTIFDDINVDCRFFTNNSEIYHKYFQEELDYFTERTGFIIAE